MAQRVRVFVLTFTTLCFMMLSLAFFILPRPQILMKTFNRPFNISLTDLRRIPTTTVTTTTRSPPKQSIMFLKTHKTGSSTLQNIFVRYAYDKNRFVGLPRYDNLFDYSTGRIFRKTMMRPRLNPEQEVQMLLHHMIFNYTEVSSVLPSDTMYFSILRDPATQFESVFNYMRPFISAFKRAQTLAKFLSNTTGYFKGRGDGMTWWFGKNNMMFDFGFNNLNESDEYIAHAIKEVDRMFDFILIAEYFDISLLLIRDLLNWDMEDIVYLSVNARDKSSVTNVTSDVIQKTYEWNKADTALYKYFNESFWKRVEKYGKTRLENDLKELKILQDNIKERCVEDKLQTDKNIKDREFKMYHPPGIKVTQYQLKPEARNDTLCREIILPELKWYKQLVKHQHNVTITAW